MGQKVVGHEVQLKLRIEQIQDDCDSKQGLDVIFYESPTLKSGFSFWFTIIKKSKSGLSFKRPPVFLFDFF